MNELCKCGHAEHYDIGFKACYNASCPCMAFKAQTPEDLQQTQEKAAQSELLKYIAEFRTTTDKIKHLLSTREDLRNMRNAEFEDWYRTSVDRNTNPDTIRRSKQKIVASDRERYGPTKSEFIRHKHIREEATKQWVQSG